MADRPSWSGGLEFAGFPIQVQLWPLVKSRSADSFKMIDSDNKPVRQVYLDSKNNEVDRATLGRAIVDGGKLKPLSQAALDNIAMRERTKIAVPRGFVPRSTIPDQYALQTYAVRGDADSGLKVLWNGLLDGDLAYVTDLTVRAGSRDSILAIYATDDDMLAVALPFLDELKAVPQLELERDPAVATVFGQFLGITDIPQGDFDWSQFQSVYRARRQEAIEAALKGEAVEAVEPAEAPDDAPDLMAALEKAIENAGASRTPAKKTTKKAPRSGAER